jgi:hypothetical protein
MRHAILRSTSIVLLAASALAQDPPLNATLKDTFIRSGTHNYGEVWGDGTTAYMGHWIENQVDLVDISNPSNISLRTTYTVPAPDNLCSAEDVNVADGLLFISLEYADPNGVQIVDVRNPNSPVKLTNLDSEPGAYEQIHTVFTDNGWLFQQNSSDNTLAINDLRTYDPDSPPASITNWTYQLTNVGNTFVHDVTARNGRLWACGWDTMKVYNIANLGTSAPSFMGQVTGTNIHSCWPSEDGQYVVTAEERLGGALRLYEAIDNGSTVTLIPRDSFQLSNTKSYCVHNPVWDGDRIYSSYYSAGAVVLELDRTTKTLELVASYDTSSQPSNDYHGSWGAFPLLGADRVLISDLENGLFVVDMSAVQIQWASARPETIAQGVAQPITVEVTGLDATPNAASVTLYASVDGGAFQATSMSSIGNDQYTADLPSMSCGSGVRYYVTASDTQARTFTDPIGAPTNVHRAYVADGLITVLHDDFEIDRGWTVANTSLTSGAWTRANPVGTAAQPEDDDPDATGTNCYVTANGSVGGGYGDADVDGGPTRLSSPTLDFSAGDGIIRYTRWHYNDTADTDAHTVELSNNNGTSWVTVESIANKAGGWVERSFRVSDYVTPTNQIKVRFSVSDQPNNSVTEAALDEFWAERLDCQAIQASATVRNGTGINALVFASLTDPVLGALWTSQIDASGHPGAGLTYVLGYEADLMPGIVLALGELLVDISSTNVLASPANSFGGIATHFNLIPHDVALAGYFVSTQGVILGSGAELVNAVDLILGY